MRKLLVSGVLRYVVVFLLGMALTVLWSNYTEDPASEFRLAEREASARAKEVVPVLRELNNRFQDVDVPFGVALSNWNSANVIEEVAIPSSFYDVRIWFYDPGFAEKIGLPLDEVHLFASPKVGVSAFQLSIQTIGTRTSCRFGILADDDLGLTMSDGDWGWKRMFLNQLMRIREVDPAVIRNNFELFQTDLNHVNDQSDGRLVTRQKGTPPDGDFSFSLSVQKQLVLEFQSIDATYVEVEFSCYFFTKIVRAANAQNLSVFVELPQGLTRDRQISPTGRWVAQGLLQLEIPASVVSKLGPLFLRIFEEETAHLGWVNSSGQVLDSAYIDTLNGE
ncbi:MAG: hypothetical protein NXH87_15705 [Rhodobiaceae bacterium]|nr:hypothetical protein [Rhodobiaceae bacterium]